MAVSCEFYEDGSFDIEAGGVSVRNAWPGIDGVAVRVGQVTVRSDGDSHEAVYSLREGTLTLRCERENEFLVLRCAVEGMQAAPHWLQPLCGGRIQGAARVFRHGLGFAGPGGFEDIAGVGKEFSHEGYLTMALVDASDAPLVFAATDHSRYLQKSVVRNRIERCEFENRTILDEQAFLEIGFATEKVEWNGGKVELPPVYFLDGDASYAALERMAAFIADQNDIELRHDPKYHFCSWYRKACYYTLADLENLLEGLRKIEPPVNIQSIQIDDGTCDSPGDWLIPSDRWPGGLPVAFEKIESAGYTPGIWVAPFMVGNQSRLYARHPDWVLKDLDGSPIPKWINYKGGGIASHIDEETYILDTSHPEAFEYLRHVFKNLREWGARMYKTDFMDWGMQDSTRVRRHTPGRTSVEYFTDVLRMIRETIGSESYWLACISPFAPFLGCADGMRIANDVHTSWSPGSLGNMLKQTEGTQYFNNVYWQNDPDVLYLRGYFTNLSDRETLSLALWDGISGGSINTSDAFHEISQERLELWRFLEPTKTRAKAVLPMWNRDGHFRVQARHYASENAWAVLFLNDGEERRTEVFAVADLTGQAEAYAWRWGPEGCEGYEDGEARKRLVVTLEPHESLLLYLNEEQKSPAPDLTLGGKRRNS